MSKRYVAVAVFFAFVLLLVTSSVCLAAEQTAKLRVIIEIGGADFWTYPYITSDGYIHKPAAAQVEWSLGTSSKFMKETVVVPNKTNGETEITTEKGAIVNLQISIVDAKNTVLGGGSLQIRNNGQTERFYITLPDSTSPVVTSDRDQR